MATMNQKDYYAVLGVGRDASKKDIQKAFQQKARKLHPDVNKAPDAEERFKEVSEAYAVLSDDRKRARYDAMRSGDIYAGGGPGGSGAAGDPGGYRGGFAEGFGGFGFPFGGGFGFPFGGGFATQSRRGGQAYNPTAGADVVIEVKLSREQARDGARVAVKYQRYEPCANCRGTGSVSVDEAHSCPTCGGAGAVTVDTPFGPMRMVCPECGGSGRVVADPCPVCGGAGRTRTPAEAVVSFPAGTHDGDVVRMAGRGHAGTNGGVTGDLVGRARVNAERLEGRARSGFYLIGIVLPFLVLSAFSGVFSVFMTLCLIPLGIGALMVASDDVLHRSGLWWKRGLQQMLGGVSNGLFFAIISVWFTSCSQAVLLSPYRMM